MIGLIVTGHGNFASGLTSSLKLISGSDLEAYEYIDFESLDSEEELSKKLNNAFDLLKDCSGILVLCDIIGGSPFKSAVSLGLPLGNVEVIAGTNLPMLIEINACRAFHDDVHALADHAVKTGQSMITKYVFQAYVEEDVDEGI